MINYFSLSNWLLNERNAPTKCKVGYLKGSTSVASNVQVMAVLPIEWGKTYNTSNMNFVVRKEIHKTTIQNTLIDYSLISNKFYTI